MARLLSNSLLCMVLLALASCDNRYHRYLSVGGAWSRNDTLTFVCPIFCGDASFSAYAGVRCMPSYPYKQLLLRVELETTPPSRTLVDTVQCDIFAADGRWNGSTAGLMHQLDFYMADYDLPACDTVTLRVTHVMDDDTLQGVCDVGLRLSDCDRHRCAGN